MRLKLSYGQQVLFSHFSAGAEITLEQVLGSVKDSHPDIYERWFDAQGHLRNSLLVFVNGDHIRYRNGMVTKLKDGDEVYVIPLLTGG